MDKEPISGASETPAVVTDPLARIMKPLVTCPITQLVMADPVSTMKGKTYEREAIEDWFKEHNTDPISGETLQDKRLIPIQQTIDTREAWFNQAPSNWHDPELIYLPKTWQRAMVEEGIKGRKPEVISRYLSRHPGLLSHPYSEEDDKTLLFIVTQYGTPELLNIVIQHWESYKEGSSAALFANAQYKEIKITDWIIENGLDVEFLNILQKITSKDKKETVLHVAARSDDKRLAEYWLDRQGGNKDQQDENGYTALMVSAEYNTLKITVLLLKNRVDVAQHTETGEMALDIATQKKHTAIAEQLLNYEANSVLDLSRHQHLSIKHISQRLTEFSQAKGLVWWRSELTHERLTISENSIASQIVLLPTGELAWNSSKAIKIWDTASGTCRILQHEDSADALIVLPTGELVIGSDDGTIKIWDTATGIGRRMLQEPRDRSFSSGINCLIVLPTGELASGSIDKTIKIWNMATGACLRTLQGHTAGISCLIVLPTGELASVSYDKTIKIWDTVNGTCLRTLQGHTAIINRLIMLPTGELASASYDNTIKIWDTANGTCLRTLQGHTSSIYSLIMLPTGELASGSHDKTIKIWNMATGACLRTLQGHTAGISCLIVLPTGELASGSHDNTIKIWSTINGACLKTLSGHTRSIKSLVMLPTGELASHSLEDTIKIWGFTKELKEAPLVFRTTLKETARLIRGERSLILSIEDALAEGIITLEKGSALLRQTAEFISEVLRTCQEKMIEYQHETGIIYRFTREEQGDRFEELFRGLLTQSNLELEEEISDIKHNINIIDKYKIIPLFLYAAANQLPDAMAALLTVSTDITITDENGMSALMFASEKGDIISVRLLLPKMTIDAVNAQNENEWTALMHAACYGHPEIVELLIRKGANIALKEKDGWDALRFAEHMGHGEIVRLLLEAKLKAKAEAENSSASSSSNSFAFLARPKSPVAQSKEEEKEEEIVVRGSPKPKRRSEEPS